MDQIFVTNTFNIDSITDLSDINDLSGDEETFFFQIVEEDDETSDCVLPNNDSTSTMNETVYSTNFTPLSLIDVENIISSIVDDKDQSKEIIDLSEENTEQ